MSNYIPISRGQKALVDDYIFPLLSVIKWQAALKKNRGYYYAVCTMRMFPGRYGETAARMHHFVIGQPLNGFVVDHINGDTLDNRRENLRIVTTGENSRNQYLHRAGKAVGVGYMKAMKRWRAYKRVGKKNIHLGCFKTQAEAINAYKEFVKSDPTYLVLPAAHSDSTIG